MMIGCQPGKRRVVATTSIIAETARRIAGDRVEVEALMGAGVDPHRYQPSPSDLTKLGSASLVLYNGLHLEGKMTEVLENSGRFKGIAVTRDLDPKTQLRRADGEGELDPHVWFDVKLWRRCTETIRDALIEAFPDGSEVFRTNAAEYLAELDALDGELRDILKSVPAERRVLITSHDAFGYFGAAYGFEVFGLQGVSTSAESGSKDVSLLAKLIGERGVPAVFTETSVPPAGLQAVRTAVRDRFRRDITFVGDGEALYSDALGEPGSDGATYAGMVRHNARILAKYLAP